MDSVLAFARRAVIASSDGMFLYPIGIFCLGLSSFAGAGADVAPSAASAAAGAGAGAALTAGASVSWLSRSTLSSVSGSPGSPCGVLPFECGAETESAAGDAERDVGGFTATESLVDAAADEAVEFCELVRSSDAASRGRLPAVAGLGPFRLMRAASWFSDGIRVELGRSDLAGASWAVVVAGGGGVDIVVGVG